MTCSERSQAVRLVLVSAGVEAEVGARLAQAAGPLARELGLQLLPPLQPLQQPDRALAAFTQALPADAAHGLACLAVDPGLTLADGRPWAQALGAWRQPTLLLIDAAQQASGVAAATTALLRQHQVPLWGLIQWGEPWQAELRRRDGLPWLGALGPEGQSPGGDLRLALALQAGLAT